MANPILSTSIYRRFRRASLLKHLFAFPTGWIFAGVFFFFFFVFTLGLFEWWIEFLVIWQKAYDSGMKNGVGSFG